MCIIVIIPNGEKIPSKETLQNCFDNNKDGMGFMYRIKNKIRIKKGFFDFNVFYSALRNIKNSEIVIHFRYATHGKISGGNCHPFPLTNDIEKLISEKIDCSIGIVHNGIISGAKIDETKNLSDTMVFIKNLDIENIKEIPSKITMSDGKFVIMTQYKTYMIGQFFYDNGIYYSNQGYKEKPVYSFSGFYGDVEKYNGCEMCDYCKNQYLDVDVEKGLKSDPCIKCDGYENFVLSDIKEDVDLYLDEYDLIYQDYLDDKLQEKIYDNQKQEYDLLCH